MNQNKKQKTHVFGKDKIIENELNVLQCLTFQIKEKNRVKTQREIDQIVCSEKLRAHVLEREN